jgi:hypothetical protein
MRFNRVGHVFRAPTQLAAAAVEMGTLSRKARGPLAGRALPVAPAEGSVVLIATWSEPSVSPSSTKLAPYRISGIAHFLYRSGKQPSLSVQ